MILISKLITAAVTAVVVESALPHVVYFLIGMFFSHKISFLKDVGLIDRSAPRFNNKSTITLLFIYSSLTLLNKQQTNKQQTDDWGWSNAGYHRLGFDEVVTPNIDSLVSDGVELDRFYGESIMRKQFL